MKKIIEFKSKEKAKEKIAYKKILIIASIITFVILLITSAIIYNTNKDFRNFIDKYIFFKNVTEENVPMIEINYDSNTNVIAFGKYICILAENTLFQYDQSGQKQKEVKIEINTPVYDVEGKYLVIGEKNNQKLYLITGDHVIWEKQVEGNISKVTVNKNGYVSVIVSGTTYKSVIITYDEKGNELFKSYLSNTIAVDATISPDNESLAYAEVSTSGTVVQSNIKIISMNEAKQTNTEPKYAYKAPQNKLIIRIKYNDKGQLTCMYEDSIYLIKENENVEILKLEEEGKKINFADIELINHIFRTVEQSTGIFKANTVLEIKNINSEKQSIYTAEEVAKSVVSYQNIIAINLGSEVNFIDTNAWLVKRYISTQEVRNIVIGDGIAGIIYRDKIELIAL